jgi:hypothetical protein
MKPRLFCPIAALVIGLSVAGTLPADIVTGESTGDSATTSAQKDTTDQESAEPAQRSFVVVPEPTMFGAVSLALAIGGGLLVRNKRPMK